MREKDRERERERERENRFLSIVKSDLPNKSSRESISDEFKFS